MATLYDINSEIFSCMEALAENGLEPSAKAAVEARLAALIQSQDAKLAAWCGYIKNAESEVESIKAHRDYLKEKQEALLRRVENSKKYLGFLLSGKKWTDGLHTIGYRKSTVAAYVDTTIPVPEQYARIKTVVEPDKDKIKTDLKCGAHIPGWELKEFNHVQVK